MKRSENRIITTHVGSLPRPDDLLRLAEQSPVDGEDYAAGLRSAVREVVNRQIQAGLDVVDDGEYGKPDFVSYFNERLGGFEPGTRDGMSFQLRDVVHFPDYYASLRSNGGTEMATILRRMYPPLVCTGPITYTGNKALERDIQNLLTATQGLDAEVFMPSISPENAQYAKANQYYRTDEEFSVAIADALNEEYRRIVTAGFLVQVDDPHLIT